MKQVKAELMKTHTINVKFTYDGTVNVRAASQEQAKQIVKEDLVTLFDLIPTSDRIHIDKKSIGKILRENVNERADSNSRPTERL